MRLYTINATPVRNIEQYNKVYTKGEGGVFTDEDTSIFNRMAINEYPKHVSEVLKGHGVSGFTIYKVDGYWEGTPEVSFKIELALDDKHFTADGDMHSVALRVEKIALELKGMYTQDAVMLTLPDNTVKFI